MRKVTPRALLISGNGSEFETELGTFGDYLTGVDVVVDHHTFSTEETTLNRIRRLLNDTPPTEPVMICFSGHGNERGWESDGVKHIVRYSDIVRLCAKFPHRILFINCTCHGHFLIKALIGKRCGKITGVISNWESFQTCYGGTIHDVMTAWSQSKLPEDIDMIQSFGDDEGDYNFMLVQRWGAVLDPYFQRRTEISVDFSKSVWTIRVTTPCD